MSSMRNAVQRRNHKERSQPQGREKWGLLEKHKDYSLRARDFNEKKKRLKILRQKAAERNPDEFAFAMLSTKTRNGQKLGDRGNEALPQDHIKGLKTQDAAYLRTMLQRTKKEIEKLEQELRLAVEEDESMTLRQDVGASQGRHTVFVDTRSAQRGFNAGDFFGTDLDDIDARFNRPRNAGSTGNAGKVPNTSSQGLRQTDLSEDTAAAPERTRELQRRARVQRLDDLRESRQELSKAETELDMQRARMGNAIGGVTKAGKTFRIRQRKK